MTLLDPKFWLALVIWTAVVAGGAYWKGNVSGKNAVLVATLTATNEALTKRNKENEAEKSRLTEAANSASRDHAKEIDAVKRIAAANAGKRVPIRADLCQPTGKTESTTSGSNGQAASTTAFLPGQFTDDLRQAAATADEVTADMRDLIRRVDDAQCFQ